MFRRLKKLVPSGLYGRAALILIVPVVTIQLVVSVTFIQRHFERVTRQMTGAVVIEIGYVLEKVAEAPTLTAAQKTLDRIGSALNFAVRLPSDVLPGADEREALDLSGREVIDTLRAGDARVRRVQLLTDPQRVKILVDSAKGPLSLEIDRGRLSASNPHQLLVLMIFTSVLMTFIAYGFLRNQLRPIERLAAAAAAFGKGQHVSYRPRGAQEVRAAGAAFLDMRARIERQIEQRTLMLSGISHDLRTPLTRLRLGLSLLPDDPEITALLGDVSDMERLVDEFLAFSRGDAMEEAEDTDVLSLVRHVVENAQRAGQAVTLGSADPVGQVRMRPAAVARALENLIGNAVRYGSKAVVSVALGERVLRLSVEDDGPGIPKDRRDEALNPFSRLDAARNPNKGGGVGLGLSIATDIARSHGGSLRLSDSEALGGLKAEIIIAR